jgi:DDE family transposase
VRYGNLPKPPEKMVVPYAQSREELKDLSCGELTEIVLGTEPFKDEIGVICDKLDAERGRRGGKRGADPLYTAWECEAVFVYQRVCGLRAVKEARDRLAGDRGADARRIFGFDESRESNPNRVRTLRVGIPSEATLSRHRRRFGERRRRGAYQRLLKRLIREHLIDFPEFREEARLLALDGTSVKTHYTCPRIDPKTKKVVNRKQVTCWDGGYVPESAGKDKAGQGFNHVILTTLSGLPIATDTIALQESEPHAGMRIIRDFRRNALPYLETNKLNVLLADGAFHSHSLRREARDARMVERIHKVSHGDSPKSKRHAETQNKKRLVIEDYPDWLANGHDEISCRCGHGHVWKETSLRNGRSIVRTVGDCKNCGHISITAGKWRKVQNVGRRGQGGFVRVMPGEQDQADYSFGNPLTYNDPLAEIYGNKRFSHNEGLNAALSDRFRFNRHIRWFRRRNQVDTDASLIYSIMHSLAMEQRRRARAATRSAASAPNTGPPGQAQAA